MDLTEWMPKYWKRDKFDVDFEIRLKISLKRVSLIFFLLVSQKRAKYFYYGDKGYFMSQIFLVYFVKQNLDRLR